MSLIHNVIDSYEEFCEKFILPIVKTGKDIAIENEYINPIVKWRSEVISNKVYLFFQNLNLKTEREKIEYISNMGDKEKIFFVETINKIIDLDDSVQNYIMSYLTEEFKTNGKLNYFQKKLYYNINSLSEEDFQIFYCIYNKYLTNYNLHGGRIEKIIYNVNSQYINEDMINVSLSRFSNLGILIYKNETQQVQRYIDLKEKENEIELQTNEYYKPTDYSNELFDKLKNIFSNFNCNKTLEIPKNRLDKWV